MPETGALFYRWTEFALFATIAEFDRIPYNDSRHFPAIVSRQGGKSQRRK